MRRGMTILSAIAFVAAMASAAHAGGMAPGFPGPTPKITGPAISGIMVVDTHPDGVTAVTPAGDCSPLPCTTANTEDKAKLASLWVNKGNATAGAIFRLPTAFAASLGCTLTQTVNGVVVDVTSARFAFDPSKFDDNALDNWMPGATVNALIAGLGLNVATVGKPVITSISNAVCTTDPENPGPFPSPNASSTPGILSFVVTINFIQP